MYNCIQVSIYKYIRLYSYNSHVFPYIILFCMVSCMCMRTCFYIPWCFVGGFFFPLLLFRFFFLFSEKCFCWQNNFCVAFIRLQFVQVVRHLCVRTIDTRGNGDTVPSNFQTRTHTHILCVLYTIKYVCILVSNHSFCGWKCDGDGRQEEHSNKLSFRKIDKCIETFFEIIKNMRNNSSQSPKSGCEFTICGENLIYFVITALCAGANTHERTTSTRTF